MGKKKKRLIAETKMQQTPHYTIYREMTPHQLSSHRAFRRAIYPMLEALDINEREMFLESLNRYGQAEVIITNLEQRNDDESGDLRIKTDLHPELINLIEPKDVHSLITGHGLRSVIAGEPNTDLTLAYANSVSVLFQNTAFGELVGGASVTYAPIEPEEQNDEEWETLNINQLNTTNTEGE